MKKLLLLIFIVALGTSMKVNAQINIINPELPNYSINFRNVLNQPYPVYYSIICEYNNELIAAGYVTIPANTTITKRHFLRYEGQRHKITVVEKMTSIDFDIYFYHMPGVGAGSKQNTVVLGDGVIPKLLPSMF